MPEIVIDLNLSSRSGSLAAAISTLRQAGLEFLSHRLAKTANGNGKRLTLTASGELADPAQLGSELASLSGVEGVERMFFDGRPVSDSPGEPAVDDDPAKEKSESGGLQPVEGGSPGSESLEHEAPGVDPALAEEDIRALRTAGVNAATTGDDGGPDEVEVTEIALEPEAQPAIGSADEPDGDLPRRDSPYLRRRFRYKK